MPTVNHSLLGPVRAHTADSAESEEEAPWIVRKLVGSMTGRVVMTSLESLRAAGTSVVCLSPWGDSNPFMLPCIRFRDLVIHTVIAATGGVAAIAAPAMESGIEELGSSIVVESAVSHGFDASQDLLYDKIADEVVPVYSERLVSNGVKEVLITLEFKHTMKDASLGFYRSSFHRDTNLFANVKDYLAIDKGWFSPYLFASARRPIIPRTMTPDVVFCHAPFLTGDYHIGQTLFKEAAFRIVLAPGSAELLPHFSQPPPPIHRHSEYQHHVPRLMSYFHRSHSSSEVEHPVSQPEPQLVPQEMVAQPRRMVITIVGFKPHRKLWSTSARPEASVMFYHLLSGCPALVVPVKVGAPLLAWSTMTLEKLWGIQLPLGDLDFERVRRAGPQNGTTGFESVVGILYEYLDLCIDWERVELPGQVTAPEAKTKAVSDALGLIVAAGIRSGESGAVKQNIDPARAGVAMWRIP